MRTRRTGGDLEVPPTRSGLPSFPDIRLELGASRAQLPTDQEGSRESWIPCPKRQRTKGKAEAKGFSTHLLAPYIIGITAPRNPLIQPLPAGEEPSPLHVGGGEGNIFPKSIRISLRGKGSGTFRVWDGLGL